MSFWSDIVRDHVALIRRTAPEDLLQEMLREAGIHLGPNGECDADSLGDLISYLEVVDTYLGKLYRERAVEDFTEIINQGWVQMDESAKLAGTLQLEVEKRSRDEKKLSLRAKLLEEEKRRAEAAMRAHGDFFTYMSHKIKTPLNGLLGSTTLLQETVENDRQRQLCDIMLRSVDTLTHTVNDIIDYIQMDAGNLQLTQSPFDLYEMMVVIEHLLKPSAQDRSVTLAIQIERELPRFLLGDEPRLQQILINLIKNSLKYTEEGSVVVSLGKDVISDQKVNIIFEVKDSGVGIAKTELKKIGQALYSDQSSQVRRSGGLTQLA